MPAIPAKRVHTRIQEHLHRSGITQSQAAVGLHMSQSAFSRRYLGYVEFRASEIEALAALLGVEISELVGEPSKAAL